MWFIAKNTGWTIDYIESLPVFLINAFLMAESTANGIDCYFLNKKANEEDLEMLESLLTK